MASDIEYFMFDEYAKHVSESGAVGGHLLTSLNVSEESITLVMEPADQKRPPHSVRFGDALPFKLRQTTEYPIPLPWEMRGVFAEPGENERWAFQMNCDDIRLAWESQWPTRSL